LYKEYNESKNKIDGLNDELERYTQIESTLQNTLVIAQNAADEVKEAAKKQAEQIIKEAENLAKEKSLELDKNLKDKEIELKNLKKEFDVYKAKMESLLISQLELLKGDED
jgi:cell division initiation protein